MSRPIFILRCRAARSAQNHVAYKRKSGRRGTPILPHINPRISSLAEAKAWVHVSPILRLVYHDPKLILSTTLNHDAILSLSKNPEHINTVPGFEQECWPDGDIFDLTPEESLFDVIDGLYLRHEHDAQDNCIDHFKCTDISYLQWDVNHELREQLKRWEVLSKEYDDHRDEEFAEMNLVHLQWSSRTIKHLKEELYLLGTTSRCRDYISSISARRIEVPEP